MKKEYDLNKMKLREKNTVVPDANKVHISIRLDANTIIDIKDEAYRLGIPYQTYICSILHRFTTGELVDKNSIDIKNLLK